MSYIDPHGKVLKYLPQVMAWDGGVKPAPVTIEWDLSNRCVLGCQDCHFAYTHTRGPWASMDGRMLPMAHDRAGDLADFDLTSRTLADVAEFGTRGIVWTGGGEPTTHPRWKDIITRTADLGLQQGMYTAGVLLDVEAGAFLADHATWVVVSLDAIEAAKYAVEKNVSELMFRKACDGVRALAGRRATIGVSFLLHDLNWHEAADMYVFAKKLGATYATFRPAVQTKPHEPDKITHGRAWVDWALPDLKKLAAQPDIELDVERFKQYRDWTDHGYASCLGIRLNTTITPDGRVWVCPNRREFADGSCLGDLRVESFRQLWARHPGVWTDFRTCRAMCRLHPVNQTLDAALSPRAHDAFI
jgi:MoaA/NifB/PqqE/SkfB family radical SAM enzyme